MEVILVVAVVLVICVVGVISILNNEKKKNKKHGKGTVKSTHAQTYAKIHHFLWENFLVRGKYRAVYERLGELGVFSVAELRQQTVKFFLQTTGIAAVVVIAGIICFQDLTASIVIIGFGYLIQNVLVDKQVDKVHFNLIKQLSVCLSSIREQYTKYGTIPDAVNECKKGKLVQSSMEKIYLILTSTDGEDRLDEFRATVPVRLLQTFANVCWLLNDSGDVETEGGTSAFKQAIGLLKSEVDLEIRKLTKQKLSFGMLEWLPVVPMFFVGAVESFFVSTIPGTAIMYKGLLGYISRLLIALTALMGYYIISIINSPSAIRTNDRMGLIDRLLRFKPFSKFIDGLVPKKARTLIYFEKLFKGSLSAKDVKYIYACKVVVATLTCLLVTTMCTLVMEYAREFIWANTEPLSMTQGTVYTAAQQKAIAEMDEIYMTNERKMTEAETTELVYNMLPDLYDLDKLEQVDRLSIKWDSYYSLMWQWWMVLIIFGCSAIMWFTPTLMIRLRKYLVKTEAEEDVMQMQTMLSILMYTSLDTLEAIYWLIQTSKIHKDILLFCYHEYPSEPEMAVDRMKSKVNLPEFQNMCDKLISTIHSVSLKEAFGDLIADRQHMMSIKEMVQETTIAKKRSIASPLAMASLFMLCVGHVLGPIAVLGIREFVKAFEDMGYA